MATYEELHGKRVEVFDTDPTLTSAYEGQVWYNEATGTLKSVVAAGAWVSTASATNGRGSAQGFGIQTAAVMAGGQTGPGNQSYVEEYNGSGWTSATAMPTTRQDGGGAGTETAGLVWCGEGPAKLNTTIEYDGSSWTTTNTYPITARGVRGSGTQTAAIGLGGDTPAPAASNVSAEYNGSTWTAGNNLPGNRVAAATSGPQTSALATTGKDNTPNPSVSNLNTAYDGTNWTAQTVYPLSLRQAASTGTSSSANLVAGGVGATPFGDAVTTAAQWDGSSWTTTGSLGTKSTHMGYAGTSTAAIICGGAQDYPSYPGVSQEFNFGTTSITAAAWSSGGALPQGVSYNSGAGIQTAALSIGGQQPSTSAIANTYEYNGSSWSEGGPIAAFFGSFPTPTSAYYFGACGTQTAAVIVGGAETNNRTVEYNGSSWTQTGDYPSQIAQSTMNGIQTAAINISGSGPPPGYTGVVATYNGSSWTASPVAFSPAGRRMSSAGTYTATIVSGGSNTGTITSAQEWDGSSWTTVGAPNAPKTDAKSTGIQTAALKMHGGGTESYDGSSWATAANMANNRSWCTGGSSNDASNTSAAVFGGSTPSFTSATEEFNGETSTTTAKTLTTS